MGFYYGLPYQSVTAGSNPARFRKGIDCSKTFKNLIFRGAKMKKYELQEIADKLADTYGNDRHFEIIKAEKIINGNYWNLTVAVKTDTAAENDEGAQNESN